jgi:hypothetical protein
LGDVRSVHDPLLRRIQEQAETLYKPKALRDWGDWLRTHREVPQTFNLYNRAGVRNEVTGVRNIIYLHVIDEKIKPEFLAKLKKYCEAFYLGMTVKIMYPPNAKTNKEFMEKYEIPSREGGKDTL